MSRPVDPGLRMLLRELPSLARQPGCPQHGSQAFFPPKAKVPRRLRTGGRVSGSKANPSHSVPKPKGSFREEGLWAEGRVRRGGDPRGRWPVEGAGGRALTWLPPACPAERPGPPGKGRREGRTEGVRTRSLRRRSTAAVCPTLGRARPGLRDLPPPM